MRETVTAGEPRPAIPGKRPYLFQPLEGQGVRAATLVFTDESSRNLFAEWWQQVGEAAYLSWTEGGR